ncbi:MAG: PaaI family thioesterase [Deltaproteobacteria bacterium]|nr:PaaI family thioesterase [Deltaproteobacteria bacterium]
MDEKIRAEFVNRVAEEPYAKKLGMRLVEVSYGYAVVEMALTAETENILGMPHGGAIFSVIDEAFEVSSNSHGTVAVGLNMSVTYHQSPERRTTLRAISREIHRTRKTATYDITVTDGKNALIASCTALVYRKKDIVPFLSND